MKLFCENGFIKTVKSDQFLVVTNIFPEQQFYPTNVSTYQKFLSVIFSPE